VRIPIFQVDAFAERPFAGNPAAVCPLDAWLPDALMQAIAQENNLSETAFVLRDPGGWAIRWFTPEMEVDLCGHATLASAWVVLERLEPGASEVTFRSPSGPLRVERGAGGMLRMVFPRRPGRPIDPPELLVRAIGRRPRETLLARDLMAVVETEEQVRALAPDLAAVRELDALGLIVTAPGREVDFVSRFFVPRAGIAEDPVTGSAHCTLVPYWSARLGKRALEARQVSRRGGALRCEDLVDAVSIAGRATLFLEGAMEVPG
jgi:predicted PhzF superfamily epimerase YddE/YHI9